MKKKKILIFSEKRQIRGGWAGGYSTITEGLALALTRLGHEVKVLGFAYNQEEHNQPYAIIPMLSSEFAAVQLNDIIEGWFPDALVTLLDLPNQGDIHMALRTTIKYIGVFPVEGAPVIPDWADIASALDHCFTLSEFGVKELAKTGVRAKLLPVGPTVGLGRATRQDVVNMREKARLADKFVVLKVADNNGRKNWAHTFEFFAKWGKSDCVLYAVTRPNNGAGWNLTALLEEYGGERVSGSDAWRWPDGKEVRVLSELGRNELAWVYSLAAHRGCLLMDTGNEGLGMPILEAMWTGLPVVGMNHTSLTELLGDGRGLLFPVGYMYRDVFGNVERFFPDYTTWAEAMDQVYTDSNLRVVLAQKARKWLETRTWEKAAKVLLEAV